MLRPNEDTYIVVKLPELLSNFEEYSMRVGVLKNNPFVKNFFERAVELERIIKAVLIFLEEWMVFQKNWAYFERIFS